VTDVSTLFDPSTVRRALLALTGVVCLVALPGCVTKPTMHLDHAEISGVQLATLPPSLNVVMTLFLDVYNPNGYDVAVRAVRGQTVMAARFPLPVDFRAPGDGLWLPAHQHTIVKVPISMPLPLVFQLVQEAMASPLIPYRFEGKADVTATRSLALEKDDYAIDEQGTVTRDQMIAVLPNSIAGALAPR
jgi:hypothetical protein